MFSDYKFTRPTDKMIPSIILMFGVIIVTMVIDYLFERKERKS